MRARSTALIVILAVTVISFSGCSSSGGSSASNSGTEPVAGEVASPESGGTTATSAAAIASTSTTAAPAVSLPTNTGQNGMGNIVYTAVGAGNFLTLARLVTVTGLIDTLKTEGPFTVFAPTDAAFAKVPAETLNALAADKEKLRKVLLYHVVPGRLTAADMQTGETKTAEGASLKVNISGGSVSVDSSKVVAPDVMATNGVIHIIDSVLLPPDL
jgi:uncharacterized surface protein with fasciclin (FAS1) repeats